MANVTKRFFFAFSVILIFSYHNSKSGFLQMTRNFELVYMLVVNIPTHHFVIYWLLQNGANNNQHQESHQRETIHDKFVFFCKIGKAKQQQQQQK